MQSNVASISRLRGTSNQHLDMSAEQTGNYDQARCSQVFMLSADTQLDEEMLERIVNAEHTRVPVYEGERCAPCAFRSKRKILVTLG